MAQLSEVLYRALQYPYVGLISNCWITYYLVDISTVYAFRYASLYTKDQTDVVKR